MNQPIEQCACDSCAQSRAMREKLSQLKPEDQLFWATVMGDLECAIFERDHYKAILDGNWSTKNLGLPAINMMAMIPTRSRSTIGSRDRRCTSALKRSGKIGRVTSFKR